MDWEFGISRCKLACIDWVNSEDLLYSTGNDIQYPVISHNGKGCVYIYIYIHTHIFYIYICMYVCIKYLPQLSYIYMKNVYVCVTDHFAVHQ